MRWNVFWRLWVCCTSRRRVMYSHSSRKRFLHECRTKFHITRCENADFRTRSVRKTAFYTGSDIQIIFHIIVHRWGVKDCSTNNFRKYLNVLALCARVPRVWILSTKLWVRFYNLKIYLFNSKNNHDDEELDHILSTTRTMKAKNLGRLSFARKKDKHCQ